MPTVKHMLLLNAALTILGLSDPSAGSTHDTRRADTPPSPLRAGSRWRQDLGVLALTLTEVEILMPTRKPRGRALTRVQNASPRGMARRRGRLAQVNSRIKRGRLVHDTSRFRKAGVRDRLMALCWARHNCRVRLTP
jgi:hypothetical protein